MFLRNIRRFKILLEGEKRIGMSNQLWLISHICLWWNTLNILCIIILYLFTWYWCCVADALYYALLWYCYIYCILMFMYVHLILFAGCYSSFVIWSTLYFVCSCSFVVNWFAASQLLIHEVSLIRYLFFLWDPPPFFDIQLWGLCLFYFVEAISVSKIDYYEWYWWRCSLLLIHLKCMSFMYFCL